MAMRGVATARAEARLRFESLQDLPLLQRAVPGEIAQQKLPSFFPHSVAESLQGHMTERTHFLLPMAWADDC